MNKTSDTMTFEELKENCILLEQQNSLLNQQNAELTAKVNWLMEQFRLNKHQRFGSSSEMTSDWRVVTPPVDRSESLGILDAFIGVCSRNGIYCTLAK